MEHADSLQIVTCTTTPVILLPCHSFSAKSFPPRNPTSIRGKFTIGYQSYEQLLCRNIFRGSCSVKFHVDFSTLSAFCNALATSSVTSLFSSPRTCLSASTHSSHRSLLNPVHSFSLRRRSPACAGLVPLAGCKKLRFACTFAHSLSAQWIIHSDAPRRRISLTGSEAQSCSKTSRKFHNA